MNIYLLKIGKACVFEGLAVLSVFAVLLHTELLFQVFIRASGRMYAATTHHSEVSAPSGFHQGTAKAEHRVRACGLP